MEIERCERNTAEIQGEIIKKVIYEDMSHLMVDGAFSFNDAWKLKKKIFPLGVEPPFAVRDKNKTLIADYKGILEIMKEEFTFRLRNREIKEDYTELKALKEYLCQMRLKITSQSDFDKWNMKQLEAAIGKLKNNKCKDPHGHINELYKNMGKDGLSSLLDMLNSIKEKLIMPGKLDLSNVSTIYKGKGSKQDVINLRGIFKLPIVRNLLDRLVYFDEKDLISESMGHFQVGNQKGRNIRDHTLVVHAVVNEAHIKKIDVDIQFTDIKQCFDSIWLDEATNDLYNSGVTTRSLNLLYEGNRKTRMCVETSFGKSDRVELNKVVMQGSVPGGVICSNQISKLCHKLFKEGDVYMYRNKIPIPPLAMVDDITTMAICNSVTAMNHNSKTNSFIEIKKLEGQVGDGKCQWVHIGKGECHSSFIINGNNITRAQQYKYLGDVVSNAWKNLYGKRCDKAQGYSATCQAMCTEISLGHQIYNIAKLLHRSIFVNGTLVNMETWPNCNKERIEAFERIEQTFFRKILVAHSKTPIEAIYLELGVIPLRFHLKKRRILYLRDIMARNDEELTKKVVLAQQAECDDGDFYAQARQDMIDLGVSDEELEYTSERLKGIVKIKANEKAFEFLINKARLHSKVKHEIYENCKGQVQYQDPRFSTDIANLLFRFRTRTFLVKNNFRNNYKNTNINCPLCDLTEDTQDHLFTCFKIRYEISETIEHNHADIYSDDVETLLGVGKTLKKLVDARDKLLNPEINEHSEEK